MTAAESCRSASPGDGMTDSYRGDSCGSFEFLNSKHNRRGSSTGRGGLSRGRETEESDDDRLFFPTRNEERDQKISNSSHDLWNMPTLYCLRSLSKCAGQALIINDEVFQMEYASCFLFKIINQV